MNDKLKMTLWSAVGLLITLAVAWWFSRGKQHVQPEVTTATGAPPSLNFGGSTIVVPGVPAPTLPATPTPPAKSCCKNCGDSTQQSGGKILQSGSFTQATEFATHALINSPTVQTTAVSTGTPIGPELIPQQNGGMPLPSDSWWENDPLYRQAYVIAYNQTVGQLAQMLMQQKRPAISALPQSYANSSSPNAAENQASNDGATQLARGGHDTRWLIEAQNNSRLMMQSMTVALNQWLQKLGDRNAGGAGGFATPPDQSVSQFLIN